MTTPSTPAPDRVWVVTRCDRRCSLHEEKIGSKADAVTALYNTPGATVPKVRAGIIGLGIDVSLSAVNRHKAHLQQVDPAEIASADSDEPVKTMDFLEAVISRSFGNRRAWKPTIADGLAALKMKQDLGGDSPFQEMLMAMAEASSGDSDDAEPINPDEELAEDPLDPSSEGYE